MDVVWKWRAEPHRPASPPGPPASSCRSWPVRGSSWWERPC